MGRPRDDQEYLGATRHRHLPECGIMNQMFTKRTLAILGSVLLLTAACSSDSSSDTSGQPASAADEARSETFDADLAVAEAAMLTLNDLPVGWSSKPREEDEDDDEFDQELADCLGVPVEEIAESTNPKAESETFVADDETEIEAEVVVAPTVAEAIDDFEKATSPEFLECMRAVLPALMERAAEEAGSEFKIRDASIGPLRIEDSGERSSALRLSASVEVDSFNVDVHFDLLLAQVGRATMQVSTTSVFSTPDVAFGQSLLDVMVERIDAAAVS
jgi:hypothetical protein